ncbi:MAG: hypothetical protein ACE5JO_00605 [Candidatus Binatia bacterium]
MTESLSSALKRILPLLNRSPIPYVLIGGLASGILGRPRATLDIDILVGGGSTGLSKIAYLMEKQGAEKVESFLEMNPMLRGSMVRMSLGPIPIDLMRSRDPHDRVTLRRRQKINTFGTKAFLPKPEDLILLKMKTERDRDLSDCIGIFEAQKDRLDLKYLWRWAFRLRLVGEYQYVVGAKNK